MKRIMILLTLILSVGLWAKPKISAKQNELNSKLFTAIEREQREEAIQLMDQGADINGCFDNGIGGYQAVIDLWSLCKPVMNGKEWQDPGQARYAITTIHFLIGDNAQYQSPYQIWDSPKCGPNKKALIRTKGKAFRSCIGWPTSLGPMPDDISKMLDGFQYITNKCSNSDKPD